MLGIPDRQCRIRYRGGGIYARSCMADAQQPTVFTAAINRELSPALNGAGGTALSGTVCKGGLEGTEYSHRAQSAPGGPYHEEVLMREETPCGGHRASFCLPTITTIPRSATPPC